jgi:hypothetical protein
MHQRFDGVFVAASRQASRYGKTILGADVSGCIKLLGA